MSPRHHVTRLINFSEKMRQHDILTTQQEEGTYELFLKNWRCHYVTMSPGYLTSLKKWDNMTFWQQHRKYMFTLMFCHDFIVYPLSNMNVNVLSWWFHRKHFVKHERICFVKTSSYMFCQTWTYMFCQDFFIVMSVNDPKINVYVNGFRLFNN